MRIIGSNVMIILILFFCRPQVASAQVDSLDLHVGNFLKANQDQWQDMNVPEEDGHVLYNIIIQNQYRNALEIGTSTGRSGIWIARALSQTGGKLTTVEIDEERHKTALKNFEDAGLAHFIDARLADAHQLVHELAGPYDFVFIDADKTGYKMYAEVLLPKMSDGGCLTAHNVRNNYMSGIREFLDFVNGHPQLQTSIDKSSRSGISVSYKKVKK